MELWKIYKMHQTHDIEQRHSKNNSGQSVTPQDNSVDEFDSYATKTTLLVLLPLLVSFALFRLLDGIQSGSIKDMKYHTFSWTVQTMASIVYAWGFALMVPQVHCSTSCVVGICIFSVLYHIVHISFIF